MCDEDIALLRLQPFERGTHRHHLLLLQQAVLGMAGSAWIEKAVFVSLVRVVATATATRQDCGR